MHARSCLIKFIFICLSVQENSLLDDFALQIWQRAPLYCFVKHGTNDLVCINDTRYDSASRLSAKHEFLNNLRSSDPQKDFYIIKECLPPQLWSTKPPKTYSRTRMIVNVGPL